MTVATVAVASAAPRLLAAPEEPLSQKLLPLLGSDFWLSLHTGEPDFMRSSQSDKEVKYKGYKRVDMHRDKFTWELVIEKEPDYLGSRTTRKIRNIKKAVFNEVKEDTGITVTHFGLGTAQEGEGSLIMYGSLAFPLLLRKHTTPLFDDRALTIEIW